jgi:hypothetical protein
MKLRVNEDFKGLSKGDILEYNSKEGNFELFKVDQEFSQHGSVTTNVLFSISNWIADQYPSMFTYIDDKEGLFNKVDIRYEDIPKEVRDKTEKEREKSYIDSLEESLQKLRKENEELKHALLIKV